LRGRIENAREDVEGMEGRGKGNGGKGAEGMDGRGRGNLGKGRRK
jgi:hypothetical protein